jgi:hypothetical protein
MVSLKSLMMVGAVAVSLLLAPAAMASSSSKTAAAAKHKTTAVVHKSGKTVKKTKAKKIVKHAAKVAKGQAAAH